MNTATRRIATALSLTLLIIAGAASNAAVAANRGPDRQDETRRGDRNDRHPGKHGQVIRHGPAYVVPGNRIRHHRDVIVVRPYGHYYRGYGNHRSDDSAYKWLAFTAITLAILDNLNESQQRAYEQAQIRATTASIGDRIVWNDGNATGSVTAVRDGVSTSGRYCREFQQQVTIGRKSEMAYGTACRQPDGTWEVVSTGNEP